MKGEVFPDVQRTTSASGFKRKADDEGLGTTKKKTTKKKASGLIIRSSPALLVCARPLGPLYFPARYRPGSTSPYLPYPSHL
ncbi:hypothetical protein FRC12_020875 [Ceratobasidium sp. 428]|nr:hypothetical protein FRC12_020875 [Ceratobasidium sp. 428]